MQRETQVKKKNRQTLNSIAYEVHQKRERKN